MRTVLPFLLLVSTCCFLASMPQAKEIFGEINEKEALRLGEKMYRRGLLPDDTPMQAYVMGDIPVAGTMFTCDDCHQRSGLGSEEGTVITWPINGKELYSPRRRTGAFHPPSSEEEKKKARRSLPAYYDVGDVRRAYTDRSLARVLRSGIDPEGRVIDPIMPKYRLYGENMRLMVNYLKNLSRVESPGVDDSSLHFATVIGSTVTEEEKSSMLSVLQAHVDAHNSQSRHEESRSASGPFYKTERNMAYRRLKLHVWQLQGDSSSWPAELESFYREQPVFGLLGGIAKKSWQPIHDFCEKNRIPSIFPITDLPGISESDWYSLYFSKGFFQEGESAAKYIRSQWGTEEVTVIQVYRSDDERSQALAAGFSNTWNELGGAKSTDVVIAGDTGTPLQALAAEKNRAQDMVVLLWLDNFDLDKGLEFTNDIDQLRMVFVSSPLLESDFSHIPADRLAKVKVTYPWSLAEKNDIRRTMVRQWLKVRKIPPGDFDIQAKMYFLGWMLPGAVKGIRSEFFREYFLEQFDMMVDQDYAIAVYPRLTFGPGQRYASKGCYIVSIADALKPVLTPVSDWVVY